MPLLAAGKYERHHIAPCSLRDCFSGFPVE
jgi:hypothetical protein